MSDDKDDLDASDWLSSQFDPTEQVPKQVPTADAQPPVIPTPVTPSPVAPPAQGAHPLTPPPPAASSAATAFPTALFPSASSPSPVYPHSAPPPAPSLVTPPPPAPIPVALPPAAFTPVPPPQPQPSAPEPNAAGGFSWGLRPGGSDQQGSPAVPPPAVPPPAAAAAPTTPLVPDAGEPTRPLSWDEFAATQAAPAATPSGYVDEPTQAYTVAPTQAFEVQPTAAYVAPPWQQTGNPPESGFIHGGDQEPTSAIDSLFGDHQFQAYEEVGVLKTVQGVSTGTGGDPVEREPRAPLSTTQKTLMGVAGGLVVVLIVIAMYFLGVHLGTASAAVPKGHSTGSATDTPTPAGSGGPAAPGVQQWSALQGGECIQPFSTAWATTFTVVSCSTDHDAQMVFKGKLPDSADTAYPTTAQFQTELTGLCSAPTAINYAAASAVTDLQVSFSYPPSQSKWIAGDRTYYCFVDRQSGGNLPADLSVKATSTQ